MKKGMNLEELAREIMRQREVRKDYLAPSEKIGVREFIGHKSRDIMLQVMGEPMLLTDHAHSQVANRLGIPKKYYDRLRQDHAPILAANVHGLMQREPKRFMVRTLDGQVRAVMSDRFRPLDNDLMLEAALPVLQQRPNLEITSMQLSERRLYLQVVDHQVEGEVKPGDVVRAGFTLSNSEVGAGAVSVEEMIWRLVCSNGLITANAMRRHHVGRKLGSSDEVEADFYQEETQEADARAFLLKLRDTIGHLLKREVFDERLNILRQSAGRKISAHLTDVVEVTSKKLSLSQEEGNGILQHLAQGGDFTQWGLTNAITRYAQDVETDRAYELEKAAAGIVEMTSEDWGRTYQMKAAA